MEILKRTWGRGIGGKLLVGGVGLLAGCCLISVPVAILSPKATPAPNTPGSARVAQVTLLVTEPPTAMSTAAPTIAPTATDSPATSAPTTTPAPAATPTDSPTTTPAPTVVPPRVVVAAGGDFVNVRGGPGTSYEILGQLQASTPADVTGKSNDGAWWQIVFGGQPGWVSASLVQFSGDPGAVVVVVEAPPVAEATQPPAAQPSATQAPVVVEQPTSTSEPAVTNFDNNGDGKVTCADFQTRAQAKVALAAGYTNLDGNGDGEPCESLP